MKHDDDGSRRASMRESGRDEGVEKITFARLEHVQEIFILMKKRGEVLEKHKLIQERERERAARVEEVKSSE
jgi:hypothetical protein